MSNEIRLFSEIERAVSYQSYVAQPSIEGVFSIPLTKHQALEGWFMEYSRLANGQFSGLPVPFDCRQISFSRATPNRINAFHIHPKAVQDELWCVVDGTMLIWLVDCRASSPTLGNKRRHILSGENPALLHIPSGVAHGYKAGSGGALLVYAMNNQFRLEDPNEGRLPWDHFGSNLWEDDRG